MATHQAPLSLGFTRQEHWSGLPFPSPMHESEKWKWSCSVVSNFTTPWTAAYQAPPSMGFSRQEYWSGVPLPSPPFNSKVLHISVVEEAIRIELATFGALHRLIHCLFGRLILQWDAQFFSFFGCARQQVASCFPYQGSNPRPLQWKHGVLTTGYPGKFQDADLEYIEGGQGLKKEMKRRLGQWECLNT